MADYLELTGGRVWYDHRGDGELPVAIVAPVRRAQAAAASQA